MQRCLRRGFRGKLMNQYSFKGVHVLKSIALDICCSSAVDAQRSRALPVTDAVRRSRCSGRRKSWTSTTMALARDASRTDARRMARTVTDASAAASASELRSAVADGGAGLWSYGSVRNLGHFEIWA